MAGVPQQLLSPLISTKDNETSNGGVTPARVPRCTRHPRGKATLLVQRFNREFPNPSSAKPHFVSPKLKIYWKNQQNDNSTNLYVL
eukprot:1894516-Amphidinium_carterae.1